MSRNKCHQDSHEIKQKLFSFRWLLKRSKSSKSAKEMAQTDRSQTSTVPSSKSCDAVLTTFEAIDKCPTFLLWKLLPPAGKTIAHSSSSNDRDISEKSPIKTSFSCNDVYSMVTTSNMLDSVASSSKGMSLLGANKTSQFQYNCRSLYRLDESNSGSTYFDALMKTPSHVKTEPNTSHSVMCKLCLTMVPASSMCTLQDCTCVFCTICLQQYITISIKEGNVAITCPDSECISSGQIFASEIKNIAGEEAFVKYEKYKLNRDVELDPNRMWCPAVGCETICSFKSPLDPDLGVSVYCINCKTKYCSACKSHSHHGQACEDMRKRDEIEFLNADDDCLIKRCPNCRVPIQKDEGCAQMMCYRCKHVFCWHCLASLDDDFLLRHYDKGPCKNKLGHSRASMIWHRTQVVGIFAGISFLLLLASPFLLLAAPCLLCCRCKQRLVNEEPTPL